MRRNLRQLIPQIIRVLAPGFLVFSNRAFAFQVILLPKFLALWFLLMDFVLRYSFVDIFPISITVGVFLTVCVTLDQTIAICIRQPCMILNYIFNMMVYHRYQGSQSYQKLNLSSIGIQGFFRSSVSFLEKLRFTPYTWVFCIPQQQYLNNYCQIRLPFSLAGVTPVIAQLISYSSC